MYARFLIHTWHMTHSCVCHDLWHDSFMCVPWFCVGVASITWDCFVASGTWDCFDYHSDVSCVWHESFIRVTRLIRVFDTTCSHVWHDKSICSTRLVRTCYLTRVYVWHDLCGTRSRTYVWAISHTFHTCMSHIAHLTHLFWAHQISSPMTRKRFPFFFMYVHIYRSSSCKCVSMCEDVNVWVCEMCQ